MSYTVKDSGSRRTFDTGAVRDGAVGKGRMDLLPFFSLMELGKHMEAGSLKYGDENWRKGIPLRTFLDSALRHLFKFSLGMKDERHDLAAMWNIACLIETKHMIDRGILPKSLDNLPDWFNSHPAPVGWDQENFDAFRTMQDGFAADFPEIAAKGHAAETAARFAAGLPYADGISDERLDELQAGFDADSWNAPDDFSDLTLKPTPQVQMHFHDEIVRQAVEVFDALPLEPQGKDPVQYDDNFNVWDVWNETWTDIIGSFRDEDEARKVLAAYVESLDRDAREYEAEDDGPLPTAPEIKAEVDERAASFIRDNPLFKVGVLDGDDGAEACASGCKVEVYAKEENPVDLFPWVIVALADVNDKRRWRVQDKTVYFTDGPSGTAWRVSSVMTVDSIRGQLTAGTMRVTQAGGAEGAD